MKRIANWLSARSFHTTAHTLPARLCILTSKTRVVGAIAYEFGDYREVDGVKVPLVIHRVDDAHFLIKLSEVKQNVAIDDTVFLKPKK